MGIVCVVEHTFLVLYFNGPEQGHKGGLGLDPALTPCRLPHSDLISPTPQSSSPAIIS